MSANVDSCLWPSKALIHALWSRQVLKAPLNSCGSIWGTFPALLGEYVKVESKEYVFCHLDSAKIDTSEKAPWNWQIHSPNLDRRKLRLEAQYLRVSYQLFGNGKGAPTKGVLSGQLSPALMMRNASSPKETQTSSYHPNSCERMVMSSAKTWLDVPAGKGRTSSSH